MTRSATLFRSLRCAGLALVGAAGLVGLSLAASDPAAAQFWGSWGGGGGGGGWGNSWNNPPRPQRTVPNGGFGNPFQQLFSPNRPQQAPSARSAPQADFSKAPPPHKPDTPPTLTVAVLGDSMADWLAYGLEDAFGETPEIGVVRKNRTYSGLIRYDTRGDTDWARTAREILAADKPSYVVMMIGLNDRQSIRERIVPRSTAQPADAQGKEPGKDAAGKDQPAKDAAGKDPAQNAASGKPASGDAAGAKPHSPPAAAEVQEGPDQQSDTPAPAGREVAGARNATHEFRSERWEELYGKLIDNTIAALKSKGVPVFWVGLPAVRGPKSMADISYLNSLYKGHAEKAGIVYVDVWDGFVDEGGRFAVQGPDFEGQTRRLRTSDGVHFTRAGALKLAHYVEREIRRVMQNRGALPVALPVPAEEPAPASAAAPPKPGEPPGRPVAGPVVPLTAFGGNSEELVGGGPVRAVSASAEPPAARVLVKGEPVPAPRGRADDFVWPRTATATAETEVIEPAASIAPGRAPAAPARAPTRTGQGTSPGQVALGDPKPAPKPEHRPRPARKPQSEEARGGFQQQQGGFFGFGAPRPAAGIGQSNQRSGGFFGNGW